MKKNRHLTFVLLLLASFGVAANASTLCSNPGLTYASLISSGGCTIGDFYFYNFGSLAASSSGSGGTTLYNATQNANLAAAINVAFTLTANPNGTNTVRMALTPNTPDLLSATGYGTNASGGQGTFDFRPNFNVTVASGPANARIGLVGEDLTGRVTYNYPGSGLAGQYRSSVLATENIQPSAGGSQIQLAPKVERTQNVLAYNAAGCFSAGCGGTNLDSTVSTLSSDTGMVAGGLLPDATVSVSKDILIKAGKDSNNFAALDVLGESFTEVFVPEPGQLWLTGGALILVSFVIRKKHSAVKPN